MAKSLGPRFRPDVEMLEAREVPANFTAANVGELIADINASNLTPEADTITLVPGTTFTLTAVNNTTHGPTGLPVITGAENLAILGYGDVIERSTAMGTPAFRLFDVAAGASLTLEYVTLQGGLSAGNYASEYVAAGGAIYSHGALSVFGCTIQNNTTDGVYGLDARGGGVFIGGGTAWISNSEITSNTAQGGVGFKGSDAYGGGIDGGGDGGDGGNGGNGLGGGLCVAGGSATLLGVSVTGNVARGGEGGKGGDPYPRGFKRGRNGGPGDGIGGGIHIGAAAVVELDAFTVDHVKKNHASTADNNISGI